MTKADIAAMREHLAASRQFFEEATARLHVTLALLVTASKNLTELEAACRDVLTELHDKDDEL